MSDATPPSAYQLAQQMGDALIDPADLGPEFDELVAAVRRLTDAAVATDLEPGERAAIGTELDRLTDRLRAAVREPVIFLGRHADGRIANLTQAGSGRLNPHAPPLVFDPIDLPDTTNGPVSVEIVGRCVLTDAHSGPPERAHGGVLGTLLDETIGLAATVAGASGLTAGLNLSFKAGTPLRQPLTVTARYVRTDGRKHIATGEVSAGDLLCATGEGVFISPNPTTNES